MYECKRGQRNGFRFHALQSDTNCRAIEDDRETKSEFATSLRQALLRDELFLEYQPIYDAIAGSMIAAEALVRWRRSTGEIVRPDKFIPVAEKEGIVNTIDRWVYRRVCADLSHLINAGLPQLRIHVNMAASNFSDTGVSEELVSIAKSFGVIPSQLCLELTERTIMAHGDDSLLVLKSLSDAGFIISLDDFGVGYSSMARLSQLPVRSFKIDRSFVHGIVGNQRDASIVRSLLTLAKDLQISVVAEGVESLAQLTWLKEAGGQYVQGFYYSQPLMLDQFMSAYCKNQNAT